MPDFYTPETFSQDKYQRTGWRVVLKELDIDEFKQRLIVNVATGRKYWPLFSIVINPELGDKDVALQHIKLSLKSYTHPMIDRFVGELETMLTDVYKVNIVFADIKFPDSTKTEGSFSTVKIKK